MIDNVNKPNHYTFGKYECIDVLTELCNTNNSGSSTMSTKTGTQSNLKCYTRAELQRKIEQSMAIAREADELAVKYNTLLKTCSTN